MDILSLLLFLLVVVIIVEIVKRIPLVEPWKSILWLVVAILLTIQLLGILGLEVPYTVYRYHRTI